MGEGKIMVTIPKSVKERLQKETPRFKKILATAKDRDINETDTVTIVKDMLEAVFGYNKYTEVTSEHAVKSRFCDLAVQLDGKIMYLIEVKAVGLDLKENHLQQALDYGANEGVPWVVLTNGIDWKIHRVHFDRPIRLEHVHSFSFTDLNHRSQADLMQLFLLCRQGMKKHVIDEYHERAQSVNRYVVGAILQTEPVIRKVRSELRRLAPGIKVSNEEIADIIISEALKRDVVEGEEPKRARQRVKRAAARRARKTNAAKV